MKFKVTQENINKALIAVSRVTNTHATLPILGNILIKTVNNRVCLTATNLEVGITKYVGAKIIQEGSITVPALILTTFINNLPNTVVEFSLEGNKLVIETENNNCVINGISSEEFPIIPEVEKGIEIKLPAIEFKKALQQTIFSTSNNENRPVLTGVYLYSNNENMYLVSTDSARLSERKITNTKQEISLLLPYSPMNDLLKIIDDDEEILLIKDSQQAMFKNNGTELICRLLSGDFPNYKTLIPTKFTSSAKIKKEDLFRIVKISSVFAKESSGSLTIELNEKDQKISIKSLTSQIGENTALANAQIKGEGEVTLNSKYILEVLNVLSGEYIDFCFNSKTEPVLIKDSDDKNYKHIIMPLKI